MLWGARFAAGCTRYVVLERQCVLQKILYHITCVNFTRGGKGGGGARDILFARLVDLHVRPIYGNLTV